MKILYIVFLLLFFANGIAQNDNEFNYNTRPFQVTFIPHLGTNGNNSSRIINKLSFNILAGYNGGVDGFEIGSVLNLTNDFVKGIQVAGFGNITGGFTEAVQVAGFMNINKDKLTGIQVAGFINCVDNYTKAVQVSGFANLSAGLKGTQVSGFINAAYEAEGVQVAGFLNSANDFEGIQVAGFLNSANKVKGLQIAGFLNICDTIDGIPIAVLSIVKKGGYKKFEFWGNETFFMNSSFKIGVKQFYTIFNLGYKPVVSDFNTGIGIGAGTKINMLGNNSLDIDVNTYYINEYFWKFREYNMLNSLRLSFNYTISDHFSIFAGPTVNILVSDHSDSADKIAPGWAFDINNRKHSTRGWFGFCLGMGF